MPTRIGQQVTAGYAARNVLEAKNHYRHLYIAALARRQIPTSRRIAAAAIFT